MNTNNASLIVTIVRKGWGSSVLQASVKAGARGGTGVGAGELGGAKDSGAASASDSITARSPPHPVAAAVGAGAAIPTRITAPQTEQRARTPPGGTLEGSTRKIELHSAHETFTAPPWPCQMRPA